MSNEELKNCPCCGSFEIKLERGLIYTMIKCEKCGLNVFDENKCELAIIKKWNKRVL